MRIPSNGTDTSDAAADSMVPHASRLQAMVLDEIRQRRAHGMTCDEVEATLGLSHQTISARVYELHKKGMIADSGQRRPTRAGRAAKVWIVNNLIASGIDGDST